MLGVTARIELYVVLNYNYFLRLKAKHAFVVTCRTVLDFFDRK
jgi:hypothetical protein